MDQKIVSFLLSVLLLLLTSSACAAERGSTVDCTTRLTSSSALEESRPVESQAATRLEDTVFTDVDPGDWFYEAVEYCRENGLMSGKAADRFAPRDNMTRAELAAVLYRHAKSPVVTTSPDFSDVAAGAWYANAVAWAQASAVCL